MAAAHAVGSAAPVQSSKHCLGWQLSLGSTRGQEPAVHDTHCGAVLGVYTQAPAPLAPVSSHVSIVQASLSLQVAATSAAVFTRVVQPEAAGSQMATLQMSVDAGQAADKSVGTHEPAVPAPLVHVYVVHGVSAEQTPSLGAS